MKKQTLSKRRLPLNRETVRALSGDALRQVQGGLAPETKITITCAAGSDCCSYACSGGCC